MTCKHCGAEIKEGTKFCENCGNKIETVEETYKEPERVEAEIVEEGPKVEREESTSSYSYANSENAGADEENAAGPIGYSIASLVCGILGLLCCCCGYFGLIVSVAGIVLGIVSINKGCEGRGMAIAGIVCGGIGAAIIVLGLIISAATGSFGLDSLSGLDGLDDINGLDDLTDFLESL